MYKSSSIIPNTKKLTSFTRLSSLFLIVVIPSLFITSSALAKSSDELCTSRVVGASLQASERLIGSLVKKLRENRPVNSSTVNVHQLIQQLSKLREARSGYSACLALIDRLKKQQRLLTTKQKKSGSDAFYQHKISTYQQQLKVSAAALKREKRKVKNCQINSKNKTCNQQAHIRSATQSIINLKRLRAGEKLGVCDRCENSMPFATPTRISPRLLLNWGADLNHKLSQTINRQFPQSVAEQIFKVMGTKCDTLQCFIRFKVEFLYDYAEG